jgi:putative ATP-dependent endonuclease of OLD family
MYLSELSLWNFRRFCQKTEENVDPKPGLSLTFNEGLNLLIGENDSGKSTILDAIKLVLLTQSREYIRLDYEDCFIPIGKSGVADRSKNLRIDCLFRGFKDSEAKNFLEWLGIEEIDGKNCYFLRLSFKAKRIGKSVTYEIKAGLDEEGSDLCSEARDLLRATYLKPLRDAESELTPGRKSRLAQILASHEAFEGQDKDHHLVNIISEANDSIKKYFDGGEDDQSGKKILEEINSYLIEFFTDEDKKEADFSITNPELKSILEKLELGLSETKSGLGSLNRLFIAAELLLLKRGKYSGLRLALIEEIEAHLHPQAQLRLIEYLQESVAKSFGVQLILTSHSPNLGSKLKLENLILCNQNGAFPMGDSYTLLEKGDYSFLERFLDVTKANLFFARGVMLVEGDAENLLIPTIATIIGRPLSKFGTSIVNMGNTAFLRYSRIFKRRDSVGGVGIRVSCVTDNDIPPIEYKNEKSLSKKCFNEYTKEDLTIYRTEKESKYNGQEIKTFISPIWTLEYDICMGDLTRLFYEAVLRAEKIQNSDEIGLTEEKIRVITEDVANDLSMWEKDGWGKSKISFEIYYHKVLKKEISKAIVAQCFADILINYSDQNAIKEKILADPNLKYLVDAIYYATGVQASKNA